MDVARHQLLFLTTKRLVDTRHLAPLRRSHRLCQFWWARGGSIIDGYDKHPFGVGGWFCRIVVVSTLPLVVLNWLPSPSTALCLPFDLVMYFKSSALSSSRIKGVCSVAVCGDTFKRWRGRKAGGFEGVHVFSVTILPVHPTGCFRYRLLTTHFGLYGDVCDLTAGLTACLSSVVCCRWTPSPARTRFKG